MLGELLFTLSVNPVSIQNIGRILLIVKTVIKIIMIASPILLIVFGMIDFFKAITSPDESGISKAIKPFIKRLVAASLVFLVPLIISTVLKAIEADNYNIEVGDYAACLSEPNGNECAKLVEEYKNSQVIIGGDDDDNGDKDDNIDNDDNEDGVLFSCTTAYKNDKTVVTITSNNVKDIEIESIEYINDGVLEYNTVDLEFSIASFPTDPSIKIKYNSVKELEIKCSKNNASPEYYESGLSALQSYSTNVSYYIYLPENIDKRDKVPLVVALHGGVGGNCDSACNCSNGNKSSISNLSIKNMLKNGANYPAIILLPIRNVGCSWPKILTDLKGLINFIIEKYEIDENKISLLGHSQGGAGELALIIDNPDMFSAAFIMSPAANGGESDTILKVPTWFVTGEKDYKNIGKYVAAFKENLSKQTNFKDMYMFTELLGVGHNTDQTLFADKNVANGIINWLISQEKGKNVQFDESIISNKIFIKL